MITLILKPASILIQASWHSLKPRTAQKNMKLGKIVIIALSFILINCNKKVKNYKDEDKLCQLVLKSYEDDQKYRQMMVDPFFKILDSIQKADGISDKEYATFTEEKQLKYGKIARAIANKHEKNFTKKQEDSIMELQKVLDIKNTKLLIDIIKKRGFPNDITNCVGPQFPAMILRHAPDQYWNEIKPLITKEYKAGRMNESQFIMVLNHINGREDFKLTKEKLNKIKSN